MTIITCNVAKVEFKVKKICKVSEMPKSATQYWSAFNDTGIYDIYRTDAGVLYSKPAKTYL